MANPIIAEVTRGSHVESVHRGRIVAVNADGDLLHAAGDVDEPTFPRSALKLMQALPLVESGAADAFGFGDRELALAGASHSSTSAHVELALSMLGRAGLHEEDLQCGPHWPLFRADDVAAMARSGQRPGRAHNNCSGKHAGFLSVCAHQGEPTSNYLDMAAVIQREIRAIIETLTGAKLESGVCGHDGCSAPTYALPLGRFARAFARLATGVGLEPHRADAARRLMMAAMAEPVMVAGPGRFCTELMMTCPGRIYAKTGAEGVYIAAVPEAGLAIALKCDDGAARASGVALAGALVRVLGVDHPVAGAVAQRVRRPVHDWNGTAVGELRAVDPF